MVGQRLFCLNDCGTQLIERGVRATAREQSEWLDTHPDSGDSDSLIGDTVFNAASSAV